MRPSLFIEKLLLLEFPLVVTPSKLFHVRRALSKLKMMDGNKPITDIVASWAMFAAIACPQARYDLIIKWIKERKADAMHNEKKDQPVTALAVILTDATFRNELSSIELSPQGLMKMFFKDGRSLMFPKRTAKKLSGKVYEKVNIPVEVLNSIAETAEIEKRIPA